MNVLQYFNNIKTFVFDVDGVLTDGTVLLLPDGVQARQMHVKDGLALQMALTNGYSVIVISGGYSEPIVKRMHYLGVNEVYLAIKNKEQFLDKYFAEKNIQWDHVLYMGDDLPDISVLQKSGVSCCPADAAPEIKKISKYISPLKGGHGCVRDVIEKVLRLHDHWTYYSDISSR
ncbi:MAG: KdsC family phosphatase [Chitinophagaceae bacterium]